MIPEGRKTSLPTVLLQLVHQNQILDLIISPGDEILPFTGVDELNNQVLYSFYIFTLYITNAV